MEQTGQIVTNPTFIPVVDSDTEKRVLKIALSEEIRGFIFPNGTDFSTITKVPMNDNFKAFILLNEKGEDIGLAAFLFFDLIKKGVCDLGCLKEHRGKDFKKAFQDCILNFYREKNEPELFGFIREENKKSLYFAFSIGAKLFKKINGNYILKFEVKDNGYR